MKGFRPLAASLLAAAALAVGTLSGCGGGGDGDQSPRVTYGKMVIFGDSLSDVGTYKVSGVAALGGGTYTVNGTDDSRIWVQRLAAQLQVPEPCAAQTGLNATESLIGFPPAPIVNHEGCFDYAQGGARVTDPIGPGNAALLAFGDPSGALGQLTVPIVTQIQRHLEISGGFEPDDLVTLLAGGNEVIIKLSELAGARTTPEEAVAAVAQAGAELAQYVKALIVNQGKAERVVVVNLPDISKTPLGYSLDEATQGLMLQMVTLFNEQLAAGLDGVSQVLIVDAFSESQNQAAHPEQYALTNTTVPACDLTKTPIGSLTCTPATLIEGDTSHYEFADTVHPTPFGYQLLAQFVALHMGVVGWL